MRQIPDQQQYGGTIEKEARRTAWGMFGGIVLVVGFIFSLIVLGIGEIL